MHLLVAFDRPRFHPLKAGRRPVNLSTLDTSITRFHPLKAGRRLIAVFFIFFFVKVSIPSRRVGDQGKMRGKAGKRRQKGGRVAVDLR